MTALLVIVAGFGVTWRLITVMMKQQTGAEEVAVSAQTRQAIDRGEAKILINDHELTHDELKHPIELQTGPNKLAVREGENATTIGTLDVPKKDDQPHFAVLDNGQFTRKRLHRLVAEWILANGGQVKLIDVIVLHARKGGGAAEGQDRAGGNPPAKGQTRPVRKTALDRPRGFAQAARAAEIRSLEERARRTPRRAAGVDDRAGRRWLSVPPAAMHARFKFWSRDRKGAGYRPLAP